MARDWSLDIKYCCEKIIAIGHTEQQPRLFFDANEFLNCDLPGTVILFVPDEDTFIDEDADNIFDVQGIELWILKRVDQQQYQDKNAAYASCKAIAKEIIAKFIEWRDLDFGDADFEDRKIYYFKPKQCRRRNIGPAGKDNLYGVQLIMYPGEPVGTLKIDNTMWSL